MKLFKKSLRNEIVLNWLIVNVRRWKIEKFNGHALPDATACRSIALRPTQRWTCRSRCTGMRPSATRKVCDFCNTVDQMLVDAEWPATNTFRARRTWTVRTRCRVSWSPNRCPEWPAKWPVPTRTRQAWADADATHSRTARWPANSVTDRPALPEHRTKRSGKWLTFWMRNTRFQSRWAVREHRNYESDRHSGSGHRKWRFQRTIRKCTQKRRRRKRPTRPATFLCFWFDSAFERVSAPNWCDT